MVLNQLETETTCPLGKGTLKVAAEPATTERNAAFTLGSLLLKQEELTSGSVALSLSSKSAFSKSSRPGLRQRQQQPGRHPAEAGADEEPEMKSPASAGRGLLSLYSFICCIVLYLYMNTIKIFTLTTYGVLVRE